MTFLKLARCHERTVRRNNDSLWYIMRVIRTSFLGRMKFRAKCTPENILSLPGCHEIRRTSISCSFGMHRRWRQPPTPRKVPFGQKLSWGPNRGDSTLGRKSDRSMLGTIALPNSQELVTFDAFTENLNIFAGHCYLGKANPWERIQI